MKKIAVLSIPGLPNGLASLNSTLYHDYKPALSVIKEVHRGAAIDFEAYVWPREVAHPRGVWTRFIPVLTIWLWYVAYSKNKNFRNKVIHKAVERMERLLKAHDELYLILHSHGNRIALDALKKIKPRGTRGGKKIIALSFAPAYSGVAWGLKKPDFTRKTLEPLITKANRTLIFRIRTDFLSGNPPLPTKGPHHEMHLFKPRWYELFFRAHARVRRRKDIMKRLASRLASARAGSPT